MESEQVLSCCTVFFYHNLIYLGALPNLQDADFQKELKKLVAADWIIIDEGFGMLTSRGKKQLAERKYDLNGLDNLRYGSHTREFLATASICGAGH